MEEVLFWVVVDLEYKFGLCLVDSCKLCMAFWVSGRLMIQVV